MKTIKLVLRRQEKQWMLEWITSIVQCEKDAIQMVHPEDKKKYVRYWKTAKRIKKELTNEKF